jgi:hypothetical protein
MSDYLRCDLFKSNWSSSRAPLLAPSTLRTGHDVGLPRITHDALTAGLCQIRCPNVHNFVEPTQDFGRQEALLSLRSFRFVRQLTKFVHQRVRRPCQFQSYQRRRRDPYHRIAFCAARRSTLLGKQRIARRRDGRCLTQALPEKVKSTREPLLR